MSPFNIRQYNRDAWDRQVSQANQWTVPVDAETIARARQGDWSVLLTSKTPTPRCWFSESLQGCRILALASGGGQQGPILAAAGAEVTVLDNSPAQLERDRQVADREGLDLCGVEGDMIDLSEFANTSFDLIFHPVATVFVEHVRPMWAEAFRVLKPGGSLLAGFMNPTVFLFDEKPADPTAPVAKYRLPYSDLDHLSPDQLERWMAEGNPLQFSHTLDDFIGGQLEAGFVLTGFYEDDNPADPINTFFKNCFATRAVKPDTST